MTRFKNSILFIFVFLILLFILRDHLHDRAFGDDLYVVWNSSYRIYAGDFRGEGKHSLQNADAGHPYLFYALVALGWRILGFSPLFPHLLTIFFASLSLLYTYKLGRMIFHWKVGLLSTLLLFFNPMFISSAATLHLNIPLQAAYLICIYYFIKGKNVKFLAGLWGVVLFKAYGIIMALGLFIAAFIFYIILWKQGRLDFRKSIKTTLLFLTAPAILLASCLLRYFLTGNFMSSRLYNVGLQIPLPGSVGEYFANFKFMAWRRFLKQAEMSLVAFVPIWSLFFSRVYEKIIRWKSRADLPSQNQDKIRRLSFFLMAYIPVVIMLLFFSLRSGGNLATYMLPFYPILYICFTGALFFVFKRWKVVLYSMVFTLCLLGFVRWRFSWSFALDRFSVNLRKYVNNSNPMNLDVTRMPKVLFKAARYIEENYPDAVIFATFPEAMAFEGEWTGYVKKKYDLFFDRPRSFAQSERFAREGRTILYPYSLNNKRHFDPRIYGERYQIELLRAFGEKGLHYNLELWKITSMNGAP